MRVSNRDKILEAAIRVIDRDGITAVTFDSVAGEAGVTRGGMMYHFKSRDALIQAINQYLADRWEASLVVNAGKPAEAATATERYVAFVRNSARLATRAELLFCLEGAKNPDLTPPWDRLLDTWAAPAPDDLDDPAALTRFIARLAADGLWMYEALSNKPMPEPVRMRVAETIKGLFDADTGEAPQ
ncbi:HTH-type transcriptional regulator BetI [Pseudomonas fluorescens]|uniref:TetR/AcrR family transcriptional regulator n=1 Tax=Pseudomonas fluorescens TaxID=294 RepID=UPI001252BC2F|nr:TetR/AcrR family transcriptional regulator [Pseudomonas fluorescens]CAG8870544.1 HTH-type transcriptional regulator BetI [Pseudomonas fluorescens]VVP69289.1 HTH-type transcriptional regulator BetI [Pseudomonas fluorescens]